MSTPPRVRTVLWDADGVLQRVPDGWEESMRPAMEGRVEDLEGFLAEAFWEERPALTGEIPWSEILPGFLDRWGIADALDEVVQSWLTIEEVDGTHDVVRALRRSGVRCALATNQDVRRAKVMHEQFRYDELLDEAFYSCELGAAKPEPAFFSTILDRLDSSPASVLFIDDNVGNVEAARQVGLVAEAWSYAEPLDVLHDHLARHALWPVG